MSEIKNNNIDDEEIVIDDDLDILTNSSSSKNQDNSNEPDSNNINVDEVILDIELPLDEESKRKLQKKDLLDVSEQYDVELTPHEENIPITSEIFKDEEFVESVNIKFPQDVINESKNRTIPLKKSPVIDIPQEEIKSASIDLDDIDSDINNTEDEETVDEVQNEEISDDSEIVEDFEDVCDVESEPIKETDKIQEDAFPNKEPTEETDEVNNTNYDVVDLDEKIENKEFISRHDVIFSEPKGLDTYNPLKITKKQPSAQEIVKRKNNLAMMFMVIFSTIVIIGAYFVFSNYKPPDTFRYEIPEKAMEMLTEEYFFISSIEEFLIEINENVEKERILIDKYVSDTTTKEDILKELNVVLKTKENLKVLYDKITPIEDDVVETKKLSDKIFENTIKITSEIIKKLNDNEPKIKIVESFNNHVDTNNSNIYMYNQYVQSVFRRYNISITIDGDKFVLDTSWLKETKK